MWTELKCHSKTKLAWIDDRATIGSARSNHIVLEGRNLKPLQAQFFYSQGEWQIRDLYTRSALKLGFGSPVQLGEWQVEVLEKSQRAREMMRNEYRNFIQRFGSSHKVEDLRNKYLRLQIANSRIPEQAVRWLEQIENEVSLQSPVENLLSEDEITDILVNDWQEIYIERRGKMERSSLSFADQKSYEVYIENLLASHGLQYSELQARFSFQMASGARAHIIGPPLTRSGYHLSIRRASDETWTLDQLADLGFASIEQLKQIRSAIGSGLNILIAGATGSGKTTLIRAMLNEIKDPERVVIIEDTPELTGLAPNRIHLRTRNFSQEESKNLEMQDLLKEALRMRPDRLVIGEVRSKEALALLMALNTGHRGCLTSLHANSNRDALWRLQSLVRLHESSLTEDAVREMISSNLHLLIYLNGRPRRIESMARLRGLEGKQFLLENICA